MGESRPSPQSSPRERGMRAVLGEGHCDQFAKLCDIVAKLRGPDGCPWDREQTNASLVSPLLEEAYEVAGAVYGKDDVNLREELGDLLLLIVMHAQIASEENRFHINEIGREINEKLIRRHPHVFGTVGAGVSPGNPEAAGTAATTDAHAVIRQ